MENRVRRNIFILIGVSVLGLIGIMLAWYFVFLRPQKETIAQLQTKLEDSLRVAGQQEQSVKEQKKAEDRLAQLNGQVEFFRKRYRSLYFGDLGADYASETSLQRSNRETAWRNWMNTYYSGLGPSLSRELINIANVTGVEINTSVYIQAPPKAPEDVSPPANGLLKPVTTSAGTTAGAAGGDGAAGAGGSISVEVVGELSSILSFFDRLNTTQTLMNIGTVRLESATSIPPRIKATFTATPYLLAAGPGAKFPSPPATASPTTATAGATTTASADTGAGSG